LKSLIVAIRNKKHIAWLFLAVIISSYAFPLTQELDDVDTFGDYASLLKVHDTCDLVLMADPSDLIQPNFLKIWFNCFSYKVLGNDRMMPLVFSVGLVYLAYLLGHYITNDRIIGLISSATLSINPLLTTYDTSPTYDQAWTFFLILSVVLLYKKSIIAPMVYPLAILCKVLAFGYLPVFIYNIISEPIKHKKLSLGIIAVSVLFGVVVVMQSWITQSISFNPERLADGSLQLLIHLMLLLPVLGIFTLFLVMLKAKTKIIGTRIVYIWMIWILLTTPLLYVFSQDFQFSYRYVPFAAFMSIFIGISIVNFGNKVVEMLPKKVTGELKT